MILAFLYLIAFIFVVCAGLHIYTTFLSPEYAHTHKQLSLEEMARVSKDWNTFAMQHSLRYASQGARRPGQIAGNWDGFYVKIYTKSERPTDRTAPLHTHIHMTFPNPLDLGLRVIPRPIELVLQEDEVRTGDREFDRVVKIEGCDPSHTLALLDAPTRDALCLFADKGAGGLLHDEGALFTCPFVLEDLSQMRDILRAQHSVVHAFLQSVARHYNEEADEDPFGVQGTSDFDARATAQSYSVETIKQTV